jgi:hypothetical protein
MSLLRRAGTAWQRNSWPATNQQYDCALNSSTTSSYLSLHTSDSAADESKEFPEVCSQDEYLQLSDHECSAQVQQGFDSSSPWPDAEALAEADKVPLYDSEGNMRLFKTLYTGETAIGEQQLIIFVRHFFCGVSGSDISPGLALRG